MSLRRDLSTQAFDVERREVTGPPTTVLEGVQMGTVTTTPQFSLSTNGAINWTEELKRLVATN